MCSDDLESSIVGLKFLSNVEGNNSGIVPREEIFFPFLEIPISNLR